MPVYAIWVDDLQHPITQSDLVDDGQILSFRQTLKRGLAGEPATAEIEIRSPGLALLQQANGLVVVDAPDGTLANGRILCRARVAKAPSSMKSPIVRIPLECAPASWKQTLRNVANASVSGAGIPLWTVKVIPDPGPSGVIAVAFAATPSMPWDRVKAGAVAVSGYVQQDLVRTPYKYVSNQVLNQTNALLFLTVPDSLAARNAAKDQTFALVAVSGSHDPTAGVLYTVGRVMTWSSAPGGRIDLQVNLADPKLAPAVDAVVTVDPTAAGLPYYEALAGGGSSDLPTAALEARSATWDIDPVTHVMSLDDVTTGDVVDLGDGGDADSYDDAWGNSPVRRVKVRVIAGWTQHAGGVLNIVSRIATAAGNTGVIQTIGTLAAPSAAFSNLKTDFRAYGGWSLDKGSTFAWETTTTLFYTGRVVNIVRREDTKVTYKDHNNFDKFYWQTGPNYFTTHYEKGHYAIRNTRYHYQYVSYDYTQDRREICDIVLDCDVQDTALGQDTLDLGTVTLGDLLAVEGVLPYQTGVVYNKGDRCLVFGRVYECLVDGQVGIQGVEWYVSARRIDARYVHPAWRDLGTYAPLADSRCPSYFDTVRGRQTIRHFVLRCRAAALKRMQPVRIGKTFNWDGPAKTVGLVNRARMVIRDGEGLKAVVGKVDEIERIVDGDKGGSVRVTITPSLGTSRNQVVPKKKNDVYAAGQYFAAAYSAANGPTFLQPTYDDDTTLAAFSAGDDVEFTLFSDPLVLPVDAFALSSPDYAVTSCVLRNPAGVQIGWANARAAGGGDPREVTKDYPTTLEINMRPLLTSRSLERNFRVHAQLTRSPRGLDLTGGGEP